MKTYVVDLSLICTRSVCVKAESENEACDKAAEAARAQLEDTIDDLVIQGFDVELDVTVAREKEPSARTM